MSLTILKSKYLIFSGDLNEKFAWQKQRSMDFSLHNQLAVFGDFLCVYLRHRLVICINLYRYKIHFLNYLKMMSTATPVIKMHVKIYQFDSVHEGWLQFKGEGREFYLKSRSEKDLKP